MNKDIKTMCELLPCPWCGGAAEGVWELHGMAGSPSSYKVSCKNSCQESRPDFSSGYYKSQEAQKAWRDNQWNTRSDATIREYQRREKIARDALESIGNNTCCTPCQEAKWVAQQALKQLGDMEVKDGR